MSSSRNPLKKLTANPSLEFLSPEAALSLLIEGDNLEVMRRLLEAGWGGRFDLIFIDPPFATGRRFYIPAGKSGDRGGGRQIHASSAGELLAARKMHGRTTKREETKHEEESRKDEEELGVELAYDDRWEIGAFLAFLRPRLETMRELLSERGSIYVQANHTIGPYIKVLMDEVFGIDRHRSTITRVKCNPKNFPRRNYGNVTDIILFYTKTDEWTWHQPYEPFTEEDLHRLYPRVDEDGRRYTTTPLHAPGETSPGHATSRPFHGLFPPPGKHWRYPVKRLEQLETQGRIVYSSTGNPRLKIYADERPGKLVQDLWIFKDATRRALYPTQKNLGLLERIVSTSSNEGGWVLDAFAGSGTTLVAAQKLGRRWVGIDNSPAAIRIALERLRTEAQCACEAMTMTAIPPSPALPFIVYACDG